MTSIIIENDLIKENLKGKVKTVKYYSSKNFNKKSKITFFNKKGFVTSEIIFSYKNSKLKRKRKYTRNYTYYANKKIKEVELLDSIYSNYSYYELEGRSVKKYNSSGYIESDTYYLTGYGDNGNGQGVRSFDPYIDIETQHTCIYNKAKNKEIWYEHSGGKILRCSWINTYDDKGDMISYEMSIDDDFAFKYVKNKYYKNGLKIENIIETSKNKDTIAKYISKYDKHNNLTEYIKYDENSKMITDSFYYTYDEHNNWISRKKYYNGNFIETIKREINYY